MKSLFGHSTVVLDLNSSRQFSYKHADGLGLSRPGEIVLVLNGISVELGT